MAAISSPVTACARMSCQIGAVGEVHSTVEQLRPTSVSIRPPEHRLSSRLQAAPFQNLSRVPRIATPSSVVALLRPYQHPTFTLFGFCSDPEFDFTELAFRLFDRRIVAKRVAAANLVDQLRQLRADLIFAGFHHVAAGALRILVNIA